MEIETIPTARVHQGRNIKRFREMLNITQGALADELNISQQALSKIEQKPVVEETTLNKVAEVMNIPVQAIKNMPEEGAINIIANTFNDNASCLGSGTLGTYCNHYLECSFNPLEKIIELYERLLMVEREKSSDK